ncbi:MAG: stage 0 sporulation family protein [Phycisphaerales bacterium]
MPILPLPQFEADLAEHDREVYQRLKPPSSVVVRFGHLKMIGEFPYSGDIKPGCGSKLVVKTHRGTELGEMLTSTCPNSGCSKSVTRQEMLQYIENSGGRDYPFFSMQGRVLRIATAEDLNEQARIDAQTIQIAKQADAIAQRMKLNMKVVDAEPILGGEKLTFHFTSEDRIDFRELVAELAAIHHTRIEMRQVGARDEARLTADYERCGQHCCCKQFLKVLKPISMKSAKIQKATLDPLKISGRCGRLMCCLRYEDQTYDELRARLPRKKSRVKTPEGWGTVLDGQILTQLVLVQLDATLENVAVPVEDLADPATAGPPPPPPPPPGPGTYFPRSAPGAPAREVHARKPHSAPPSASPDGLDLSDTPPDADADQPANLTAAPTQPADRDRDRDRARDRGHDRDRRRDRDRAPRDGDRPQRDPRNQRGPRPAAAPPSQRQPRPPAPPADKASEIDDLLASIETDFGRARRPDPGARRPSPDDLPDADPTSLDDDGPPEGPGERAGGGESGGRGGRRRRRRRRRGGGGGGAGAGGPPGQSPSQ